MRCLHVGIFNDHELGGDIILASGLEDNDVEVEKFDYRATAAKLGVDAMNARVVDLACTSDFLLIGKGELINPSTLKEIRQRGTYVTLWYGDLRPTPPDWLVLSLPWCDVFFMTSAGNTLRRYYKLGQPGRAAYFLFPADPKLAEKYSDIPRGCGPPLFTGTFSSFVAKERREVLKYLHARGDVRIIGSPKRYINNNIVRGLYRRVVRPKVLRGRPYIEAIRGAKLGIGVSAFQDVKYYTSDRLAHYLTFGTPYLAYRFPGCEDLFTDGVDLVFYDGVDDLDSKVSYYLSNPAAAEEIGARGQHKMLSDYNRTRMVSMMLDIMRTGRSDKFSWVEVVS